MTFPRTLRNSAVALGATAVLTMTAAAGTAVAEPPNIPSPGTAETQLNALEVAPDGSSDGYDRDLFPHWSSHEDNCNTRELVLERDGDGVEVGTDCYPTDGSWYSEFDGETVSDPSEIDIDHVVPLANAWRTGASEWTTAEREEFANDLDSPQLIAVTASSNRSKGDSDPSEWQPISSYHCTYASMWITVKHEYELTVHEAEKASLKDMLSTC
ncbi:HNH endonuclease family protein [Saccharomonospora sp. CUA-673]|uniref:HNH endonuclease family protein n=1 Tax=Saccharomonospora sp. CUA-673 TaxID=1904969 RepID=UPI00096A454F|nr:HNH endonuclease family protein [Saccharomonospora sp. CUA-673]